MELSKKKELIRPDCPQPIDIEIEDSDSYSIEDEELAEIKDFSSYSLKPVLIQNNENENCGQTQRFDEFQSTTWILSNNHKFLKQKGKNLEINHNLKKAKSILKIINANRNQKKVMKNSDSEFIDKSNHNSKNKLENINDDSFEECKFFPNINIHSAKICKNAPYRTSGNISVFLLERFIL